jgi:hypothetical protein
VEAIDSCFGVDHVRNRLVGLKEARQLGLAHLGPSLHRHIEQWLCVVAQVRLGLGSLICRCKWTQLDLVQAFRSQLVILVRDTLELA